MNEVIVPQRELNEECGIIGIKSKQKKALAYDIYFGLFALQHRGQESAGIAVSYEKRKIYYFKKMGLVSDVFEEETLNAFPDGDCAIGHVRYSTTGSSNVVNAQPVVFYGRFGRMAIAHNGNIINCDSLKSAMMKKGHVFQSSIDSEVIASLINLNSETCLLDGIIKTCSELEGAYSLVIMADDKLVAVRDRHGLKPLVIGKRGDDIVFASETCALDSLNAEFIRDIKPGEIVTVDENNNMTSTFMPNIERHSCIFEYVYLARSDSSIDGRSVYDMRYDCGKYLAELYKIEADVVAGVPDSAIVAARAYSEMTGIPLVDALSKNRYVGRTFIQPSQSLRENGVRVKLNAIKNNINGKRLVLIDDSIVRGTTSKKIIKLLRDSGAKEVHMLIASPIVKYPCFFGVDMDSRDKLIGGYRSEEEICEIIGADSLHYLPIEYLIKAAKGNRCEYCAACFDGNYPIEVDKYNCGKFVLEI
ncbi:MAG: amidophosphoribosyltransferase [Clostridiales bacterium]|nr:amidophosphoribosyltransferase [Clostridiales bacterium]